MTRADAPPRPEWPSRWWWIALAVILIIAGALRFTGYRFSLPFVDHLDEPSWTTAADSILQIGTAAPIHQLDAYPPGIVTINYFLLRWFHNPAEPPTTVLPTIRLMSITAMLGLAVLIALLAYRAAGELAGLIGAWVWAVGTALVEHSRWATADNFLGLFCLLAILLAVLGTVYDRNRWMIFSTLSLIAAILFKYQAILYAPLVFGLMVWRLRGAAAERRRGIIQNIIDNGIIFAVFLFWLLALTPALGARNMAGWDQAYVQAMGIPTPETLWQVLGVLTSGYASQVTTLGLAGLLWHVWKAARAIFRWFDFAVCLAAALIWWIGISFFGVQGLRHSIAGAAMFAVLIGVGLAGWVSAIRALLARLGRGERTLVRWIVPGAVVGLIVVLSYGQLSASIANAYEHTLPDRRNDLADYFETTLEPGTYVSDRANHKVFDRFWGGFEGTRSFPLYQIAQITERPLAEWREAGVTYAIVAYADYEAMLDTADGQAVLDGMVLLRSYPPDPAYRGPSMVVFRIYPMQNEATGQLGPIRLLGYDLDNPRPAPGDTITLHYYWQASAPTEVGYQVFTHLTPPDTFDLIAQADATPVLGGSRPTSTWTDPDEIIYSQAFSLTIPESASPGQYRVLTGFYRLDTGARLLTGDGESFLVVATIRVVSQSQP